MQLSIIIVNYNVKFFLEHCLLSVLKACKEIKAEIIVVDNNSIDGSKEYLTPKFPAVKFIWNNINVGFGKANNSAVSLAQGDYILFLNPDTILPEDCFEKCLSFFEKNRDCGAVGVRMIDGSGAFLKESKRCLPTPPAGLFKMINLTNAFPESSVFAKYYAGHLAEKENNKVEILAGAFMMLSKKAIKITRGFDEAFFMYGEDIDLSYRIMKCHLQNYYLGEITILHFKGESTQKKNEEYRKHFYGAMKLFIDKHYKRNLLKHAAMSVAITLGKSFAKIKILLTQEKSLIKSRTRINKLFVGEEQQYELVKPILKNAPYSLEFFFNILKDGKIAKINMMIKEKNIGVVIFGESESFTNSEIIKTLEFLSSSCRFLFYENGADSIIGSHNKNERGEFISTF
jgi:GT2 family glycosyltransferase